MISDINDNLVYCLQQNIVKIYEYKDYDEYVEVQKYANKKKLENSYVDFNSLFNVISYGSLRALQRKMGSC